MLFAFGCEKTEERVKSSVINGDSLFGSQYCERTPNSIVSSSRQAIHTANAVQCSLSAIFGVFIFISYFLFFYYFFFVLFSHRLRARVLFAFVCMCIYNISYSFALSHRTVFFSLLRCCAAVVASV